SAVGEVAALRMAGRPHGPLRARVEPDDGVLALVLERINVRQRADSGIGVADAGRAPSIDVEGRDLAVLRAGDLDLAVGRRPVARRRNFRGTIEQQLDRLLRLL